MFFITRLCQRPPRLIGCTICRLELSGRARRSLQSEVLVVALFYNSDAFSQAAVSHTSQFRYPERRRRAKQFVNEASPANFPFTVGRRGSPTNRTCTVGRRGFSYKTDSPRGQTKFLPPLQASRPLWAGEETKQQGLLEAPRNQ